MIRLGPLLARRGHLGGARGGGAILRLSGWGCFTFISSPSPFGDMIGHKGRERQGGRSRRVRRTVSSSGTVTLAGRFMSAMLSTGFAPGTVTGPTRAFLAGFRHGIIISVWTDRSPEGTAPVGNSPQTGAPPPPSRGHSPGERGDTAREDSVGYLTRTSGSRRGRQSAMAAQLELSQVGPRRSLKLRPANNRPTPSLPFPSPGCASRLGR